MSPGVALTSAGPRAALLAGLEGGWGLVLAACIAGSDPELAGYWGAGALFYLLARATLALRKLRGARVMLDGCAAVAATSAVGGAASVAIPVLLWAALASARSGAPGGGLAILAAGAAQLVAISVWPNPAPVAAVAPIAALSMWIPTVLSSFLGRPAIADAEPASEEAAADAERPVGSPREAHPRLVDMERLAAAQELAGEVAHAINNPLAVLHGRLQMRLERPERDPEDEKLYALVKRIGDVVDGMLRLSDRSALHPLEVEAHVIVDEVVRACGARAEASGLKLATAISPGLAALIADVPALTSAIGALVDNAIDALEPGGTVKLTMHALDVAGCVAIEVADDGCGMDPALLDHASQPFFTTRPSNAGLGLTLAHRTAMAHGGRLLLESASGHGTRARLELPILAAPGWIGPTAR